MSEYDERPQDERREPRTGDARSAGPLPAGAPDEGVADIEGSLSKTDGWGGNEGPELSPEQVAGLQQRQEPVAAADFGEAFTGDLGRTDEDPA